MYRAFTPNTFSEANRYVLEVVGLMFFAKAYVYFIPPIRRWRRMLQTREFLLMSLGLFRRIRAQAKLEM